MVTQLGGLGLTTSVIVRHVSGRVLPVFLQTAWKNVSLHDCAFDTLIII
jgi:hypothetical protein